MDSSDSKRLAVLVTGAAGFVGTNFLRRVAGQPGLEVNAVYHERRPIVEGPNIHIIQADLRDQSQCERVVKGVDRVFMFAGRLSTSAILKNKPLGPVTENTLINLNMLEAASKEGVTSYVWLSSSTGYPRRSGRLREPDFFEDDPPSPYEPVGWMSRYIEKIGDLYSRRSDGRLTVISLRPTGMYGPYDDFDFETCHALPALMRRVWEGHNPVEIWGSGQDRRDYIYVDDVVEACLLASQYCKGSVAFNIGSGKSHSLNEALTTMLELAGREHVPRHHRGDKEMPVTNRAVDCQKAKKELKFQAKTPLKTGIRLTMEWYRRSRRSDCPKEALSA